MSARGKARKRALDVLYAAEMRGEQPLEALERVIADGDGPTNDGRVLYIELPASVELLVQYTEPGLQGDRSTGGTKPATVETGATVNVPLFITTGEKIKVDTRDGRYLGRS